MRSDDMGQESPLRHFPHLSVMLDILNEKISVNITSNVTKLMIPISFIDFI